MTDLHSEPVAVLVRGLTRPQIVVSEFNGAPGQIISLLSPASFLLTDLRNQVQYVVEVDL